MGTSPRARTRKPSPAAKPKARRRPHRARPARPTAPPAPRLEDVLRFRFSEPIERFSEAYYVEPAEAEVIWTDMLRYLWFGSTVKGASGIEPPRVVDEMWHTFLMYTHEYTAWSLEHFGEFVHHEPRTSAQKDELDRMQREERDVLRDRLLAGIALVWEHLGEETVLRWYVTYPRRFTAEFYDRRKPTFYVPPNVPQALLDRAPKLVAG